MRTGFIGTGRITRRLVPAVVRGGGAAEGIRITRRSESISTEIASHFPHVTVDDDPQTVVDGSDALFVCLPPDTAAGILGTLSFQPGHRIISVMNGVSLETLHAAVAPATDVAVTLPLPFIEQGGCPLPVYPDSAALHALLGGENPILPLASEGAMAPFWATSGTLASVMAELATTADWLGERIGDPVAAERYVLGLYGGWLSAMPADGERRFAEALADLGTPGGFNARMHERIETTGHFEHWRQALHDLYGSRSADTSVSSPAASTRGNHQGPVTGSE